MSTTMEEDEQRQTGSEGMGWAASLEAKEGGYGFLKCHSTVSVSYTHHSFIYTAYRHK